MGLFTDLVQPAVRADYKPWDDFWYQPGLPSMRTQSGVALSPDAAMRVGAVYACVGLLSDMVGTLPLILYREINENERERAKTHPLYKLLRRQPNVRQTAKEWRTLGMNNLLLRGNFYNRIEFDGRGAVAALWPLHPDRVTVTLLASGRRGYLYRPPQGQPQSFTQDEITHVMAPHSLDNGITGAAVLEFARESTATALAQELYAGRFWSGNAAPAGLLTFPPAVPLSDEQRTKNREEWERLHGGQNAGRRVAVLSGGATFTPVTINSRDAQFVEGRQYSKADIACFFRVPPHMIGDTDRSTSWGTGIEQQTMGFVNFTLAPWLEAFAQALDRDVVPADDFFTEFLTDAILKGDTLARANAYALNIMNGVMAENEARVRENLKPWPGLWEPRRSANQDRGGNPTGAQPTAPTRQQTPPNPDDTADDDSAARARAIALEAAGRLVRKEVAAIRKWAPRYQDNPKGWRGWVTKFYGSYVGDLEAALGLAPAAARAYCATNCALIVKNGGDIAEEYERNQPAALAALALEGIRHGGA